MTGKAGETLYQRYDALSKLTLKESGDRNLDLLVDKKQYGRKNNHDSCGNINRSISSIL